MDNLPHNYEVTVTATPAESATVFSEGLPVIEVAPPKQFDGPGDKWSPEELLMASVSNCLVLSFRAIAKASKLQWSAINVRSSGELNKVGSAIKFTNIQSVATLEIGPEESIEKSKHLLQKAEASCFVTNSLNCEVDLEYIVLNVVLST